MRTWRTTTSVLLSLLLLFISCSAASFPLPDTGPKYIFLFIGDGMGANHILAAGSYAESDAGVAAGASPLRFDDFPVSGMATTHNYWGMVTDSAAAATAIASGRKTSNGIINMNPAKTERFLILSKIMRDKGFHVGIISNTALNSATPAAFFASSPSRDDNYDIATQLAHSSFDYFGGGGLVEPRGADGTQPDAFGIATDQGFEVVRDKAGFLALVPGNGRVFVTNEILDGSASMAYALNRESGDLSLADFTQKGIDLLSNGDGFFMMIEGGKIDKASHSNDAELMVHEVLDLDAAIGSALAFYESHPDDTLIVVTSDHETGGLSIAEGSEFDYGRLSWSTTGHTGQAVRVFALGLGQQLFSGSYDNTGIFDRLKALLVRRSLWE
ncbi:MAG: alkaline phosphatase [Spirochaetales bacterium]